MLYAMILIGDMTHFFMMQQILCRHIFSEHLKTFI